MKSRLLLPLLLPAFLAAAAARGDVLDDDLASAKALLLAGNVEDASARLDALEARARVTVAANADDAHAQYILGMAAMYAGHDQPAKTALSLAARLDPQNVTYIMGRAQFALYTDAPKDAVAILQAALAANGKNLELLEMLGHAQQEAESYADALLTFQKAFDLAPREARYLAEIAECQVSLHQEDDALATYQRALEVNPKYTLALANIGQIHQTRKDLPKAVDAYMKLVEIDPNDYRALAKIVQLNEALGKTKERDVARVTIFALHLAGKIEASTYCREQFTVDKTNIMVFESFELTGPTAVRYAFNLLTADGKSVEKRISLGSYLSTTAIAREMGQIKANERMFHLDVYTDGGHETLGMFTKEPTYEETRDMVKQYLAGKLKPMAASSLPTASKPSTAPAGGGQ